MSENADENEIPSFCRNVMAHLLRDAQECEVCVEDTRETSVTIERGFIHGKREKRNTSYGVRTILEKRRGFVAGTLPTPFPRVVDAALSVARTAEVDPNWHHLPYPKQASQVEGICDKRIVEMQAEALVESASLMLDVCSQPGIFVDSGRVSCTVAERHLENSHGLYHHSTSTRLVVHLVCRCGESESTWGVHTSHLYDADFTSLAEETAERARAERSPRRIDPFRGDILFLGEPVEDILLTGLKRSIVGGSERAFPVASDVASEVVTVYDDGTLYNGVNTSPVDGEGNPTQKTEIIAKGISRGVLHNEYTANMAGVSSTGNGIRTAVTQPVVGITNLILESGRRSYKEMAQEIKRGILVGDFTGNVDAVSGLWNGVTEHTFYIEKGEILYPVKGITISGNVFDCLTAVEVVAKERWRGESGIYSSPVLIRDFSIGE